MAKRKSRLQLSHEEIQTQYLAIQSELTRTWRYDNPRADLTTQLATLRPYLDPDWLAGVRTCTTPPAPFDLTKWIPEFRDLAKTTVRLNPRRGTADAAASKLGGLFLWPTTEEWPCCAEHQCKYVPVLQLRKQDFPEVSFREDSDLMQILWCPNDHQPNYCPTTKVFWRKCDSFCSAMTEHVELVEGQYNKDYVPESCIFYPERILEYPDLFEDLPVRPEERLEGNPDVLSALELNRQQTLKYWHSIRDANGLYHACLSTVSGIKLGGHPDWINDPWYPSCACGAQMECLVSFASREFDGASWFRWLPIEERDILAADWRLCETIQSAPNLLFGDAGNLYVFICRNCPEWLTTVSMQFG